MLPGQESCHVKTAVKKLVGSTDSPLGKAGDRSVIGGGGGWRVGAMEDPNLTGGIRAAVDKTLTCVSSCRDMALF